MDAVQGFFDSEWLKVLTAIITAASMAAAITPNKYDGMVLKFLRDVIDLAALNFGHAKNEKK